MSVRILSTGAFVPKKVLTNDDLTAYVDTNDEWIRERTGIRNRHVITDESALDMAVSAARQAIDRSGITAQEIDLIILSTFTSDTFVPTTAGAVRAALGITNAVAFDINAACTGFIYGVGIAHSMMQTSPVFRNALVIGCEALSRVVDWTDRSTCVLFGDGAGAAVLQKTDSPFGGILSTYLNGETDSNGALTCGAYFDSNPFAPANTQCCKVGMNGQAVFRFAVGAMVDSVKHVLDDAHKTVDDVNWIVPHQANERIINLAAKKMKVSVDKVVNNIAKYGNTSSASVPLALNELYESGNVKQGDLIVLTAFGGGFTSGAVLFEA